MVIFFIPSVAFFFIPCGDFLYTNYMYTIFINYIYDEPIEWGFPFSNAAIDSHKPVKCRVENINLNKQNNDRVFN